MSATVRIETIVTPKSAVSDRTNTTSGKKCINRESFASETPFCREF